MPFDFKGLYEFHGHRCPMSTLGARLGLAAMTALAVTKDDQFLVEGHCYARNCALDGIQYATGCTVGNGNLTYEDGGRPMFKMRLRDGMSCVYASVSEGALARLMEFKTRKAALIEERPTMGLVRAGAIDAEISREFDALIEWVQTADDRELLVVSGDQGGEC